MITAYRLTKEELRYLTYAYSLKVVPPWLPEELAIDGEDVFISLERKELFIAIDNHYIPSPLIGFMFENMAKSDYIASLGIGAICYCSEEIIIMAELHGNCSSLIPFDSMETMMCYCEAQYSPEDMRALFVADSPAAANIKQRMDQLWRA